MAYGPVSKLFRERLHNPAIPWHLIISLRDPAHPDLRPFAVRKDPSSEFGISAQDDNEGSEKSYTGPEVTELRLVVDTMEHVDAPGYRPAA